MVRVISRSIALSPRYLCRSLICRQFFLQFSFSGQMNSGKNGAKPVNVGVDGPCRNISLRPENGYSNNRIQYLQQVIMVGSLPIYLVYQPMTRNADEQNSSSRHKDYTSHAKTIEEGRNAASVHSVNSEQTESRPVPDSNHKQEYRPPAVRSGSDLQTRHFRKRLVWIESRSEKKTEDVCSTKPESMPDANFASQEDYSSLPTCFGKKHMHQEERAHSWQTNFRHAADIENFVPTKGSLKIRPFDICWSRSKKSGMLKETLHEKNWEKANEIEHTVEGTSQRILRPGMVLLKHYITLSDQVKIVKRCRELGLGPGGFYQPGYHDGAKLRLQMMCLGLNWDPETRKYENRRSVDDVELPDIPHEFSLLVYKAIEDAHALIKKDFELNNVEDVLPAMHPNICIVNFYTNTGRLGLHQDRDESRESLDKGIPVVSFSVGDSAEFLYGDRRDVDKAEKILLESGDVLIFGGRSRHIFHGVRSILPNSAPKAVLEEAMLRDGRLNLTFRQY